MNKALPYGEYKLENAKTGFNLSNDEDKIEYLKKATAIIGGLSPVEQEIYIKHVAKDVHVSESAIRMELSGNKEEVKEQRPVHRVNDEEKAEVTDLTSTEKTLLKILFTDEAYIEKIGEYDQVMESEFAKKLYDMLTAMYNEEQRICIEKIRDRLSYNENKELNEILDQVLLGGNEKQVFEECMRKWHDSRLRKEEQRLITLLSLADEETNQESVHELMDRLIKVQKQRKKNTRGI